MQPVFAHISRRNLALLAGLVVVSACSAPGTTALPPAASSAAPPATLMVYAAASLTAAFRDLATAYRAATGTAITLSFDSSATLETQIEQGAPADILASADTTNADKLVKANLAAGAPVNFARNELTIIVPGSGTPAVNSPPDLAKSGVKVIAAGDSVPITKYANQLIANLAKEPGYPSGFAASVAKNIASREDNVKGIVAKIETGDGDAGIVYVTDAKASTMVKTVDVPTDANVPATYAAVAVKASKNAAAAAAFLTWLGGSDAQAILAKYGFLKPG